MDKSKNLYQRTKYYVSKSCPEQELPVYIDDLRSYDGIPYIHFPDEYTGQPEVKLVCSQHYNCFTRPDITPAKQKKITQSWVDFLTSERLPLKRVQLCCRVSQQILDAVCNQQSIEFLRIKWCAAPDLTAIARLINLKQLYVGIGTSVTDISALGELRNLEALCLDSTTKIHDYSPLGRLSELKALDIGGNFQNKAKIDMDSDKFLYELKKLEFLHLPDVRVKERGFLYEENVRGFRYSCFRLA